MIGKRVGKIKIIDQLAEGGMGEIYLGFDEKLKRKVAVKVISGKERMDDESKARFLREAEILSKLEHPNICRIYDYLEDKDDDFLILELIEGKNLTDLIQEKIPYEKKLHYALQIAEVLIVAHTKGIVHRDLKPSNIMITKNNQIKLLDFGLSHSVAKKETTVVFEKPEVGHIEKQLEFKNKGTGEYYKTISGSISGTLLYMSPEQALGDSVQAHSDIYSLGLLYQWLFTEKEPYKEELTQNELYFAVINGNTLPVTDLKPDITRLINQMKEKSPNVRPSIVEVRDCLKDIIEKPGKLKKRVAVLSFFILLMLSTLISTVGFFQATRAKKETENALKRFGSVYQFMEEMLTSANPYKKGAADVKMVDVLESALGKADNVFGNNPLDKASVYKILGETYRGLGDYEKASDLLNKAYTIREKHLGKNHKDTLQVNIEIATYHLMKGEYQQSEQILQSIEENIKLEYGENSIDYLKLRFNIALSIHQQGNYLQAETMYRTLLETFNKLSPLEKDPVIMLKIKRNLAIVLRELAKLDDAEKMTIEVLKEIKNLLGQNDLLFLETTNDLAEVYYSQTQFKKAEYLYRELLEKYQKKLGDDHPECLMILNNIALVCTNQNKNKEAEHIYRDVIQKRIKLLGEDNQNTLVAKNNLAISLYFQRKYSEAEREFSEVMEKSRKTLGNKHLLTQQSMNNLAKVLSKQHKLQKSLTLYKELLTINKEYLGNDHPVTTDTKNNLAEVLLALNKVDDAEKIIIDVIEQRKKEYGETNVYTMESIMMYSKILIKQGNFKKALILLNQIKNTENKDLVKEANELIESIK